MGYGQNLKEILDRKGMTVKELALKAKIALTTLYSIIQRDTAIRFDTALRIANILDIPIDSICKDNPYNDIETLPTLPLDHEKRNCIWLQNSSKFIKFYVILQIEYVNIKPKMNPIQISMGNIQKNIIYSFLKWNNI